MDEIKFKDNENTESTLEQFRVKITNIPGVAQFPQIKRFFDSHLKGLNYKKLSAPRSSGIAYISLTSKDDYEKAMAILNGLAFKNNKLIVTRVTSQRQEKPRDLKSKESQPIRSVADITTPLSHLSYKEQLEKKFNDAKTILSLFIKRLVEANVKTACYIRSKNVLKPIIPSPVLINYRNKCEFTIGRDVNGEPCVGFVSGRMSQRKVIIVSVDNCNILTDKMRAIVNKFCALVKNSNFKPFDEFARTGFWRQLTIRDFVDSCMLIVTVYPLQEADQMKEAKQQVIKAMEECVEFKENKTTSIYWQVLEHLSDPCEYDHISGESYVYENLLGVNFRVSPATFFQTNTRGAEILYTVIGNLLGLPQHPNFEMNIPIEQSTFKEMEQKVPENTDSKNCDQNQKPLVLLDICCGAGTIGQCLLHRVSGSSNPTCRYACVGVELIKEAVKDAETNALKNGFSKKNFHYICGQAEIVFRNLNFHIHKEMGIESDELLGILDPPRAGLNDKVIISCRKLERLRKLVYVSCDPKAALKNLVDLCRPESKKFEGDPFRLHVIQPVDMFPQTNHIEWAILLTR